MNTTPNESTWPQTTLSNQLIGFTTATNAAARASRSRPPSSRTIDHASQPIARSAMIGGTLISSTLTPPTSWPTSPTSHSTYM